MLRLSNINSEIYVGDGNLKSQMKYADKRNSPVAIIVGSDEASKDIVQLKDLALGSKISKTATLEHWKSQPAQKAVKRQNLISEVNKILDRVKEL